jgi:hypothetical protein
MSKKESTGEAGPTDDDRAIADTPEQQPEEYGGPKGKEPTRYGDWEKKGRCIDF